MLTTLLASLLLAQAPAAVDDLTIDRAALEALARVELKIVEDGKAVTYSGVPLAKVLDRKVKDSGTMPGLRALSDAVVLVNGSDGYQAAFSAASVAIDPEGSRFFLALAREGKPLDKGPGPIRLIVPGDPRHVRWVKDVASIRLVRLDQLVKP